MGKKSLTKSTTKKKKTTEKKSSSQVSDITLEPVKTPKAEADEPVPAASEKKKPAAKKPAIKTLLKKDFGAWVSAALFAVSPDAPSSANYTAPLFIDESDPAKAKSIRILLSKQFDLSAIEEPAPSPPKKSSAAKEAAPDNEAAPEKPVKKMMGKKALSISELLSLKFEFWQPDALFTPSVDPARRPEFAAPPWVDAESPQDASRIKALLARQLDLSVVEVVEAPVVIEPAGKADIPIEEPAPAADTAKLLVIKPEKAAEPPQKEEKKEPVPPKTEIKKEPAKTAPKPPTAKAPEPPAPVARAAAAPKPETMSGPVKLLLACIAGIYGLLILASAMNTQKYYLKPAGNAVEIWQGTFSPKGRQMIASIPGTAIAGPAQSVYTKEQALAPAFDYYMKEAESLGKIKGLSDFEGIRANLYNAIRFAPTLHHQTDAKNRLNKIECLFLIQKADEVASKGTLEGYNAAINDLGRAKTLDAEGFHKTLLDEKLNTIGKARTVLMDIAKPRTKITVPIKRHQANPE